MQSNFFSPENRDPQAKVMKSKSLYDLNPRDIFAPLTLPEKNFCGTTLNDESCYKEQELYMKLATVPGTPKGHYTVLNLATMVVGEMPETYVSPCGKCLWLFNQFGELNPVVTR